MKFINLTPHTITLNDGSSFPTEWQIPIPGSTDAASARSSTERSKVSRNLRKMSPTSSPPWFSQQRRRMVEQMWLPQQQDTRSVNEKTASLPQYRDSSANDCHWLIYDKVQK